MEGAARLLRLLTHLQTRPRWPGSELAERLGVTERTLRRDVVRLRDLGYPIEAAPGVAGGYQLGHGGRFPPLLLDDDEAVAVALGLRIATTSAVHGVEDAIVAALAKITTLLPPRLRQRVDDLTTGTVHMPNPDLPRVDTDVLATLAAACHRSVGLRFAYVDNQQQATERSVEPLRVVHTGRRWYLVARDKDRDDWRTFRIDRITRPWLTEHPFTHVDPPDPIALVAEGMGVAPYEYQARIVVHAPVDAVARRVPPTIAVVEADGPDRSVLRVGANELGRLVAFACDLPFDFEVLEPAELRTQVRELGQRLLSRHQGAGGE